MPRLKALILADSCNPEWPSLPVVGFKAAMALAELVDATVATSVRNRPNIEKVGMGKANVVYIDNEYVAKSIHKLSQWVRGSEGAWTTAMAFSYPSYLAFEHEVMRTLGEQLARGEFDIVHRVTPMSPTLPSVVAARVKNVPFVLGPLNGGLRWPQEFHEELRKEREWMAALRGMHKYLPYHKKTFDNAAAVLAGFQHTIDRLHLKSDAKVIDFPEVGFDPDLFSVQERRPFEGEATILYAGRLVPYKLPDVVVRAFVQTKELHKHRLIVAGDGPMRAELVQLVATAGLSERVSFLGKVSQTEVGRLMRESDIFAFPSIRELGAGVLIEAMACSMACVVVDYGAPGALAQADRGLVLPLSDKVTITKNLAAGLSELVSSPAAALAFGEKAREFAFRHYTWAAKAEKTVEVYNWVLGKTPNKPTFA